MMIKLLLLVGFVSFLLATTVTPVLAGGVPIEFSTTCPYTGTLDKAHLLANKLARFSWNQVEGADKYLVRVNKEPFEVWNPADKSSGDYARLVRGHNRLSHLDQVSPDTSYKWSVQALRPGEEYSPQGNLSPWISFVCLSP